MPTESTPPTVVERIRKNVKRFRILCVGRSGVGKSSIINHVFRIKDAPVSPYDVGDANITRGFTSSANEFLIVHDSKGFEPGDNTTFDIVSDFIKERCKEDLPLQDQLHAVWLCMETPRSGARVFETGDEKLLKLTRDTQIPTVLVFTKYDRLVRTMQYDLKEENGNLSKDELESQGRRKADELFKTFMNAKTVKATMAGMRYIKVSTQQRYDVDVSKLVDFTGDVVLDNFTGNNRNAAWLIWAIAQRASLRLKIDAWLTSESMAYYVTAPACSIREILEHVHQDIVTFWNFMDEKNILQSKGFMGFILLLVQDAEESRKQPDSQLYRSSSQAIRRISQELSRPADPPTGAFSLADDFRTLLGDNASDNAAQTHRLLMTYAADLTEVLRSLFDVIIEGNEGDSPDLVGAQRTQERTSWPVLRKAYTSYEHEGSRQRIHARIHEKFKQEQQALNPPDFLEMFSDLVRGRGHAQ